MSYKALALQVACQSVTTCTTRDEAEAMMRREGIKWLSSTHKSIEEIATTILQEIRLDRQSY